MFSPDIKAAVTIKMMALMPVRKRRGKKKPGRDFEQAVHCFVQALDPAAEVLFDHSVPDVHTNTPRQVDV
jgi:hypothetical protein